MFDDNMKDKFLEILKNAYPKGFDPQKHSGAMLQLWREETAFALEAAAQHSVQRTCSTCGSQSFNDYQGYLKCNVCGSIASR